MARVDGPSLLRAVGLMADGPVVWGRPVPTGGAGVYVVELPAPLPSAPIELTRVGKWIERVPGLRLDGVRPTSKDLAARIASYWLPEQVVLYIGSSTGSVGGRVRALAGTPLGDRRPFAGGQWLHTLRGLETLRVWWAGTDAPEETEDALLDVFADATRGGTGPSGGPFADPLLLPFAVLRRPTGERRAHGITGATLPEAAAPPPPTTVRELPPAEAPETTRSTGGRARPATRTRAVAPTGRARTAPAAGRRTAGTAATPADLPRESPVHVSAEGLERLRAELDELVRVKRPAIVRRVAAARELGDLSENAEYHAAREELGFLDGRVHAVEDRIRRAVVVEAPSGPHAGLGSTVVVEVEGLTEELRLVGSHEADPRQGRISTSSPVGRALVGRLPGEEAVVSTPSGAEVRYRVVEVR